MLTRARSHSLTFEALTQFKLVVCPQSKPLLSSLSALGIISPPGVADDFKAALIHHYIPVICLPLSLTALLYIGPLYACALDGVLPFQRNFSLRTDVVDRFTRLAGVRTYILVRHFILAPAKDS